MLLTGAVLRDHTDAGASLHRLHSVVVRGRTLEFAIDIHF